MAMVGVRKVGVRRVGVRRVGVLRRGLNVGVRRVGVRGGLQRDPLLLGLLRDAIVTRPDGFYLSFTGKGSKTRTVPLVGFAYPAMFDWLAVRRHVPSSADEVFVTLTGCRVVPRQIARECKRVGERIRARYRLTPHVLRRTFATRLLASSGDIRGVQELLGHATIQTTEVYTHVDEEGLRELVEATALGAREHARGPVLAPRMARSHS